MHGKKQFLAALPTLGFILAATAEGGEPIVRRLPPSESSKAREMYQECTEDEADTVLILEFTVAGLPSKRRYEFPLQRLFPDGPPFRRRWGYLDDWFQPQPPAMNQPMFDAGIRLRDTAAPGITVDVYCYWRTADLRKGQFDRKITVKVDAESKFSLGDQKGDCELTVMFRKPDHQPARRTAKK